MASSIVTSFSSELALQKYQTALALYKRRNDKEFILSSQDIMDLSLICALNHLQVENAKIFESLGFPVISIKKDNSSHLVLVMPIYEDDLMKGIRHKTARIETGLDEIVDKYTNLARAKNASAEVMFLRLCKNKQPSTKEKILTLFGWIWISEPMILPLDIKE